MKKNIINILLLIFIVSLTSSCENDIDIWDSNTLDYSGRYMVKTLSEDMKIVLHDFEDNEFRIYNTNENIKNNIWIDDENDNLPLKSKFTLNGDSKSFSSIETTFSKLENNLDAIEVPDTKPTALGQTELSEREYIRVFILEGKILPKQAKTKGKNIADSIYVKFKLLSGTVKFKSEAVPVSLRADPTIEEFNWKYDSATHDTTKDEVLTISGHSYTGFSEDEY